MLKPMSFYRQAKDWLTDTANNQNTYSIQDKISINLIEKYNPIVKGYIPAVISNGVLFDVDKNQRSILYAVDVYSNVLKWQYVVEGDIAYINWLIGKNKMVYLATGGKLIALEDTGSTYAVKWVKEESIYQISYDETNIYYVTREPGPVPSVMGRNQIVALDQITGAEKGRYSVGSQQESIGRLLIGGGRIYFTLSNQMSSMDFKLYGMDIAYRSGFMDNISRTIWYTIFTSAGI